VVQVTPAPEKDVVFAHERHGEKSNAAVAKVDEFGLSVQPVSPDVASGLGYPKQTEGLVVTGVKGGSPAAKAGLEEGDLVTKVVVNKKIQPAKTAEDLLSAAKDSDELTLFVKDVRNPENDAQVVKLSKKASAEKDEPKVQKD
jgi:S1-C subfamily serine protease